MTLLTKITVDIPYPKEFEFREEASTVPAAVGRSIRKLRKELKGRRIKTYKIVTTIL